MSAITLDTVYNNPDLPTAAYYDDQIMAHPAFRLWLRSETNPTNVDVSGGLITAWRDVKSGSIAATQETAANQATLTPAAIGSYSAATFDGSRRYGMSNGDPVDFTLPYTIVCVSRSPGYTNYHGMCGKWDSATAMAGAIFYGPTTDGVGGAEFRHGGKNRIIPYTAGVWDCLIASVNATQMQIRNKGVDSDVFSPGASLPTTSAFGIGAVNATGSFPMRGDISDLIFFQTDALFSDRNLVRLIELQMLGAYPSVFSFTPQSAV